MKKIYSLLALTLISFTGFAQLTLLSQTFDTYDGDSANFIPGYYISWNSPSTGLPSQSFYSSTGNYGIAPNSYKFGIDSATIITPAFIGADSLTFWYKGNNTGVAANVFYIYESADSITFNLLDSITSFPTVGLTYGHGVPSSSRFLKFLYRKAIGNVAFDDLKVFNNQGVGIKKQNQSFTTAVYPNPSATGIFTFDFGNSKLGKTEITIFNIIGKLVFSASPNSGTNGKLSVDLSSLSSGSYFASVKSGNEKKMIRLVIN
jgi:Secretion system C-terminal sorting domain